jgi:DNA-binding HxlR family transcriptional regulator
MRDILDRVGDRWSLLVLFHLLEGTRRFGELKAEIGDISPRVLTETVRHLEQDGLVSRRVYSSIPPKVEYTLTDLGRSLTSTMRPLVAWAESNRRQIAKARHTYETRKIAES